MPARDQLDSADAVEPHGGRSAPPGAVPVTPLVVHLDDVSRYFGETMALDGLSMSVPAGSITVVLGPNGAGKTTCTRVVTGALGVDAGTVRVLGADPGTDGREVRSRIGIVSAKPALYDRLSGRDNLRYAAELYGLGRKAAAGRLIDAAADRFGIVGALDQRVGGYSTGMKTRLALARSVLHDPDLLLYDEPTSGLDPESSHAVLGLIREMTEDGTTVLMCTHLLLEAEGLADQVVMLQDGRALVQGHPDALVRRYWPEDVVVVGLAEPAPARVGPLPGVSRIDVVPDGLRLVVTAPDAVPDAIAQLVGAGLRVRRVEPESHTLEELYFTVRRQSAANRIGEVHA